MKGAIKFFRDLRANRSILVIYDFMKARRPGKIPLLPLIALIGCAVATVIYLYLPDYRNAIPEQQARYGTAVLDRQGRLLRLFPDGKGRMGLWCDAASFPDHLKSAVLAAEDRRFYYHPGFDPIAIARAAYSNLLGKKPVSGASTITQQVVRLIHPRPRTYGSKIVEVLAAVKMEMQLSKDQILELHLNLSPMGGNIRGVGLAARTFFGKDVRHITIAEAAVQAALPRAPSRLDPRRAEGRRSLFADKDRILKRMASLGWITEDQLILSLGPTVAFDARPVPLHAPHFVDLVIASGREVGSAVKTSLDLDIQAGMEQILVSHRNRLRKMGINQAAAIVTSGRTGEVLALIGSFGYAERGLGYNNGAFVPRSAGSTLKPFLYALALEKGYGSAPEISDTDRVYRTPHGDYVPVNSDRREYGPVHVRSALGNSLNVSAVKVAQWVGLDDFYRLLDRVEAIAPTSPPPGHYGLGLAVGNVELSLYRLVQAYQVLASGGEFRHLRLSPGPPGTSTRVLSRDVAYVITHILADPSARLLTFGNPGYFDFGFPVAVKTGTSSNYRDAWLIGYTSEHVVGLWAGNFDGRPSYGKMGAGVCGPIFKEVVGLLYSSIRPEGFSRPATVRDEAVCSMSGKKATKGCPYTTSELIPGTHTLADCDLPHQGEYHDLGTTYARWLHRRELLQGTGRFRLLSPEEGAHRSQGQFANRGGSHERRHATQPGGIEIVTPHAGDRFIFPRHKTDPILFRAVPVRVVEHVTWYLDGMELAVTGPPYEFPWEPTRGMHELMAVTPDRAAAKASFFVE